MKRTSLMLAAAAASIAVLAATVPADSTIAAAGATPSRNRYVEAVLADHPVGYWRLDDPAASSRARDSAGDVDGFYHGPAEVTTGVTGAARRFDGLSGYVSIPNRPQWSQPTTHALTVEFWMRPDRLVFPREEGSGYVWILGKGEPNQQEWGFRMYGSDNRESPPRGNRISFYAYNPVGGEGAGAYFQDRVVPGTWIYVVGELTPVGVKIYKDGVLRQGPPASATLYANPAYRIAMRHGSAPIRIGTRNNDSYFAGAISDVAIYPYLLSDSQIHEHYEAARDVQRLRLRRRRSSSHR